MALKDARVDEQLMCVRRLLRDGHELEEALEAVGLPHAEWLRAQRLETTTYPPQGSYLGARCEVVFNYDLRFRTLGTVIRDDTASPGLLIIQLDDGRVVLSTECQWHPL